ncbi:hypothetical protein C7I87_35080 [Mesorhizobium sp. SARCC-RB16n]|nr:hypothetical protein C7I87_35080 [Mesorhizobium sp. SARCC-RB16n]
MTKQEVLEQAGLRLVKVGNLNQGPATTWPVQWPSRRTAVRIVRQLRLQQILADIRGAASSNEGNRTYAVDRLRVLVEEFVRELYGLWRRRRNVGRSAK